MRIITRFAIASALVFGFVQSSFSAEPSAKEIAFFEKKVRPLLVQHCYKCHSSKSKKLKGDLLLDSREGWMNGGESGAVIVPGKPEKSLLIRSISHEDSDLKMPEKTKLSDEEIRILTHWVAIGAPDPRTGKVIVKRTFDLEKGREFWAFQPMRNVATPKVKNQNWPQSDIDRFILNRLEAKNLIPVSDADRRTLIRRATFDLLGLPPTPKEVNAFLNDKSPDAFDKVVDRLLASKQFGERWGRHWLDIARYAESTGKTRNYPYPNAWRYRDYVIESFNRDKPYDQFVTEQIAGDLLPSKNSAERHEQLIATGFLALGTKDLNERNLKQFTMDNVDEQIDVMSRSILALSVSCARCHNHKFDPIPTADYYALAGVFRSTELLAGLGSKQGGGNRYRPNLLISLGDQNNPKAKAQREHRNKLQGIVDQLAQAQREIKQHRKIAQRKDFRNKSQAEKLKFRNRNRELQTKIKKLTAQQKKLGNNVSAPGGPLAMGVRDASNPKDCRVHIRGEIDSLGDEVPRGFIQVASIGDSPKIDPKSSGRLELAQWITRKNHPLTARVMTNRIWHHLFGQGLVRTVDNFGLTGEKPSHPELLDHLALKFIELDWSIKKMIRSIMLTRAYRLSSQYDDKNYQSEPDNRLVWRMSQRRIEVEALRDAMLSISGELELQPVKGSEVQKLSAGSELKNLRDVYSINATSQNRSVYLPILRGHVPPALETFDFADPNLVKGRRDITTVATQALFMMNSPFVMKQSRLAAQGLLRQTGIDDIGRIQLAYQQMFSRPATEAEQQRAMKYIEQSLDKTDGKTQLTPKMTAWTLFCQALFASAEFRYLN